MRLIDADALTEDCKRYLGTLNPDRDGKECTRIHWLIGVLANALTIDERKTGRWIDGSIPTYAACSECGYQERYADENHFCPNCGAKMNEGEENE